MFLYRLSQFFSHLIGLQAARPQASIDERLPDGRAETRERERIRDDERVAAARRKLQVSIGTKLC